MANKYDALAGIILKNVGGKENITSLTHCITRLRFTLKNESLANTEVLSKTEGVIKVLSAGGQYQVVVGTKVEGVFEAVCEQAGIRAGETAGGDEASGEKKSILNSLMDTISGILAPTLGVMVAAGITKGLVSLAATLGWVSTASGLYMILYALGDGFYYFLPVLLGFTAARKFQCSEFIGASIGAALVYPDMVNISSSLEVAGTILSGTPFAMDYYNTFLGIPVIMPGSGYTSSVIPVILAVYAASKIEKACKKNIPVVGGIIAGALIGGGFGILVMFGLHWVIISLGLSTIAITGFDYMLACASIGPIIGMFQGIAICIAARNNQKVRDLAVPATISQICGIGEPLMYSILVPLKKPLYLNILAGCVGGAVLGLMRTKLYTFAGSALFSFPNFVNPAGGFEDLIKYCVGVLAGGIFVFVVQILTYKDSDAKNLL